jgi:MFS family permease
MQPGATMDSHPTQGQDITAERTMRRVTTRLVPFLLACYFISFLDRINVSFAALQMNRDLGLTPPVYGFGAGLFFLTYCVFEVPSNLLLYRFGATRWIARIMISWGVCAAGMAFVAGPASFYTMRLLLGAAEAGFFPGVLFFLTLWFPNAYRGRVLGWFMAGVAISGAIGGPLSGLLLGLDTVAGLHGWQWLFIVEGVPAILLAPIALIWLKDGPADAHWLPAGDRNWLTETLATERQQRDIGHTHSIFQALTDIRVLGLAAMYFTNVCMVNSILFFQPLIIKSFGLTNLQTGFISAIPSIAAFFAVILWGRHSDARQERFGHAAFANGLAGAALLVSVLLTDPTLRVACLTVALAGTLAFTPPFWAIAQSFLSGAAAAGGIAAISSLGVLGGFVAPSIIGYFAGVTGDFRWGIGFFGCLAILAAGTLYAVGRSRTATTAAAKAPIKANNAATGANP